MLFIIWSPALITGRAVQRDLGEVPGAQQIGTAAIIAANTNAQLQERQRPIARVAAKVSARQMHGGMATALSSRSRTC